MKQIDDHLQASEHRTLELRSRSDLEAISSGRAGENVVLRDPLSLEIFHLSAAEFFLLQQLAHARSLAGLKRLFEERFAPQTLTLPQLQHVLHQMLEQGLLLSTAAGQATELRARASRKLRSERWQRWLSLLSFRLAHWNSTSLVEGLYRRFRWVFSPIVGLFALAIIGYAAWLTAAHFRQFASLGQQLPQLAFPRYWLLWLATLAAVKFCHEMGHALTCRHFGGRCREMGVMLLAGLPCFYCDVTDAWRTTNRWQRIGVSMAGIAVEICLAAAAVIAAWHAQPGLLQVWLVGVAVLCSLHTLVVNANPLLRYDGYYVLSDLLRIPNLSSRSRGLLRQRLKDWLLGEDTKPDPLLTRRQQRQISLYALGSRIYGWLVLVAIFAFLLELARPVRLETLVYTLATITLVGIVAQPAHELWQFARNPFFLSRLRRWRLATVAFGSALLVAAILFFPLGHTVEGTLALVPDNAVAFYAPTAGRLVRFLLPGSSVQPGDVVVELVNPELDLQYERRLADYRVQQANSRQLSTLRSLQPMLSAELPAAEAEAARARRLVKKLQTEREKLILRSQAKGVVLSAPPLEPDVDRVELSSWNGQLLDPANQGCWVEAGAHICSIGDPTNLKALVAIDERDISQVQPGDPVEISLASEPSRILSGHVRQVASRARMHEHAAPSQARIHLIEVELDQPSSLPLPGARGWAKVAANRTTLWQLVTGWLDRRLRLPW